MLAKIRMYLQYSPSFFEVTPAMQKKKSSGAEEGGEGREREGGRNGAVEKHSGGLYNGFLKAVSSTSFKKIGTTKLTSKSVFHTLPGFNQPLSHQSAGGRSSGNGRGLGCARPRPGRSKSESSVHLSIVYGFIEGKYSSDFKL